MRRYLLSSHRIMKQTTRYTALLMAALMVSSTGCGTSEAAGVGVKVQQIGGERHIAHSTNESVWTVASPARPTAVSWSCGPLVSDHDFRKRVDATLSLVDCKSGKVVRGRDATNEATGRRQAVVAAQVAGRGEVQLVVEITDPFCPAGDYTTTVHFKAGSPE